MSSSTIYLIIILALSCAAGFAFMLFRVFRRGPAISLDEAIKEAGYAYDERQNIFYSRMDAWQRQFGFCKMYDEASVPLGLIYDCEPVRFEYGGKKWMIEFWKGQYGMTTGCEVGVYTAEKTESEDDLLSEYALYDCAADVDMLPISIVLKKKGKVLFKRSGIHWWLTGFILGEFSEPTDLTVDIALTLKDKEMLRAFMKKMAEIGYSGMETRVFGNTVIFTFAQPKSIQPRLQAKFLSRFSQWRNRLFCREYKIITRNSTNIYEAANILKDKSPRLFKRVFKLGKPDRLFSKQIAGR